MILNVRSMGWRRALACITIQLCVLIHSAVSATLPTVPDAVLYAVFFRQMDTLDQFAARIAAEGKNPAYIRDKIRNDAGLSAAEFAILKKVATDCNAALAEWNSRVQPLVEAGRRELDSHPGDLRTTVDRQLQDATTSRTAIIERHIQTLKAAFGAERFARFNSWARSTFAPNISAGAFPTTLPNR
jgi:hypothetical protein